MTMHLISKEYTFINFSIKFAQVILTIVQYKTFASKNLRMRDIGLSTFKQLENILG